MKKFLVSAVVVVASVAVMVGQASAHVVVKPAEVKTGGFQTFTMGVPNEKDQPVTNVKLVMPAGLKYVSPTQKSGWQIEVEKAGTGEDAAVKSITWTSAEIAAGFRDDFTFSAQAPAQPSELQWKAYQTYADGTVVSWDKAEDAGHEENGTAGPFSVTRVVATTADSDQPASAKSIDDAQKTADLSLYAALAGFVMGLVALLLAARNRSQAVAKK